MFKPGYVSPALSEVQARANGIDLAAMQVKRLQKIEELTLHEISQRKRLNEQLARIQSLETENAALRATYSP